ncbi:MAG: DNA repair protein RadA [Bacteroidales bacterium]|nr:DNA repair protein RadA [Bacteroidales bacterium]
MAKTRTRFVCQSCGAESAKWIGRCPSCNEWNTYVEEVISIQPEKRTISSPNTSRAITLSSVSEQDFSRIDTQNNEINRVLGGGLVPGSVVLLGGEPGIGKSTLALQMAISLKNLKTLYISGEESASQIKLRGQRLGDIHDNLYILCETNIDSIHAVVENEQPNLVIIDSIQTLFAEYIESSPGSVSQIRECASRLIRLAKSRSIPLFIIGHIVKDGSLAGPKTLEHMVDTVLQFEGDRQYLFRILRTTKNRFGSTSEIGIFEMQGKGLIEVPNPSEIFLSHSEENLSGIAVAATINGNRPYLIELQSLVSSAVYGTPQRSSIGFDLRRLNMLLAVLEKRAGFRLAAKDVFLNVAGGLKIEEPSVDLAIAAAILSSNADLPIGKKICMAGEISLSGEIRPVYRVDQRVAEALKLGFQKFVLPIGNRKMIKNVGEMEILYISKIEQLPKILFG